MSTKFIQEYWYVRMFDWWDMEFPKNSLKILFFTLRLWCLVQISLQNDSNQWWYYSGFGRDEMNFLVIRSIWIWIVSSSATVFATFLSSTFNKGFKRGCTRSGLQDSHGRLETKKSSIKFRTFNPMVCQAFYFWVETSAFPDYLTNQKWFFSR